ncbi:MAG: hypothetical protein ACPG4T_20470, partial [Nannocystaceae bacterium]
FAPLLTLGLLAVGCDYKVTDFQESDTEATTSGDPTDSETTDSDTTEATTGGNATTEATTGGNATTEATTGGNVDGCGGEVIEQVEDLEASIPEFEQTPAQILAAIQGPKTGTVTWQDTPEFVATSYDGTASPLNFELTPTGEVRLVEVELHGEYPDGNEGGELCSNVLEFDAELTFTSEDGVFALTQPTTIHYRVYDYGDAPGKPQLYHTIELENAGSLTADDFTPSDGEFMSALLIGSFTEGAVEGELNISVLGDGWTGAGFVASFNAN